MENSAVNVKLGEIYDIECIDKDGNLRWSDNFHNIVTVEGLTDSIDKHFKASGYTSAWYVGLFSGTISLTDSMASHNGWSEINDYSEANRQTLTLGNIVSGSASNVASKASFSISGTCYIGGAFSVNYQTKAISSGTVYGGGAFSGGVRQAYAGDTLNVTVIISATN